MCELTENLKAKSRIGYKVAVKKGGKYYSPAMGHEYKTGDVPIITEQKEMGTGFFIDDILFRNYKENMVGRSAAFVKKEDAKNLYFTIFKRIINQRNSFLLKLVILKVRLSKELMNGEYKFNFKFNLIYHYSVIAGKHMKILKEVQ